MSFFKYLFEKQPPGSGEQKRVEWLAITGIIGIMWIIPIILALLNFWLDIWFQGDFNSKIFLLVMAILFGPFISFFYILANVQPYFMHII